MPSTLALDDQLHMSLDSLIKLQRKQKGVKAGTGTDAKAGSSAKKKAGKSSQKDARTTKHAGVLAPQNGNGVTKKKKKSAEVAARDNAGGKNKSSARSKPSRLDFETALRTADELQMTAAQLLSAAAQSRSGAARRKQQPAVRAKAPQHQQAAPQQRQTRRVDRTGPSRREEREQPTRRWGGERGFEERGGFLPGARQPRRAEDEHFVPRYSHHDDRGPPQPQQQVIREIRYVPMPAPAPEPQYAEPPAAWAPPVQSFQPTRQPFQPARQQPPPQYEVPQPRAARQQPQAQYAPAPRAPRGQQMHPLYDDERVAAAGSAGFSDDEMEDAVAGGAIVKEEPAAAARPTAGHWTRHSGRHPANAIGWVAPDGTIVYTKK